MTETDSDDTLRTVFARWHPNLPFNANVVSSNAAASLDARKVLDCSVQERADVARLLLYSLPTPDLYALLQSVQQEIKVDFISLLPRELSYLILSQFDAEDLLRCGLVSTFWRSRCIHDQALWKALYVAQGWTYDKKAVEYWNRSEHIADDSVVLDACGSDDDGLGGAADELLGEGRVDSASLGRDKQSKSTSSSQIPRLNRVGASPKKKRSGLSSRKTSASRKYDVFNNVWKGEKAPSTLDLLRISPHHYASDNPKRPCVNFRHLYRLQKTAARNFLNGNFTISDIQTPDRKIDANGQPVTASTPGATIRENHSYCLQFDGSRLLVGNRDSFVRQYDTLSNRLVKKFSGHEKSVLALQYENGYDFDPKQEDRFPMLVTGSSDYTARLWNLETGECVNVLTEHTDSVLDVNFQPKENILATCSKDRTVRLWRMFPDVECLAVLRGHRGAVNAIVVAKNKTVASVSGDRQARIWSTESFDCLRIIEGHSGGIASLWFNGETLITGSSDSFIRLTDVETGNLLMAASQALSDHDGPPVKTRIVSTPVYNGLPMNGYNVRTDLIRTVQADQRFIVTGSYDKSIKIFDRKSGHLRFHVFGAQPTRVFALQFDTSRIICCSEDGQVRVFDYLLGEDTSFLGGLP